MNRHSNTSNAYDTDIQDLNDYEYQQEIYSDTWSSRKYVCRDKLNGCQRLRSERALDVFELEKLRNGK